MIRGMGLLLGALLATANCSDAEHERRQAEITRLLAQARTLGQKFDQQWRTGVTAAARGDLAPRADLGPCPVPGSLPFGGKPSAVPQEKLWSLLGLAGSLNVAGLGVVEARALAQAHSPRAGAMQSAIAAIERDLADPKKQAEGEKILTRARALADPAWWTFDLVVLAEALVAPRAQGADQFQPGLLVGRAFVFDYQKSAIVCAAQVRAASSAQVKDYRLRLNKQAHTQDLQLGELQTDLFINACRTALSKLVLAGPKAEAGLAE